MCPAFTSIIIDSTSVKLLENEIDDLKRIKGRLEKASMESQQKIAELSRQLEDTRVGGGGGGGSLPAPSNDKAIAKLTEKMLEQEELYSSERKASESKYRNFVISPQFLTARLILLCVGIDHSSLVS
jgi:hypothetical protein